MNEVFQFPTIAPEKAETVERLNAMKANDWRELATMSREDLETLRRDTVEAAMPLLSFDHPHNLIRAEAKNAIQDELIRRNREQNERYFEQQRRRTNINRASSLIAEAAKLVEYAAAVPDLSTAPEGLPKIKDVTTVSDEELTMLHSKANAIMSESPSGCEIQASAIALLKTPESKQIAEELKQKAKADAQRRTDASMTIQLITAETERREQARAREEYENSPQGQIDQLQKRIAALESHTG